MHQFDALQHLVGDHQHRLEGESATTYVELILQGRTQQVHNHQVVRILRTEVMDLCKAGCILQFTVHLVFVTQLWASCTVLFKLYSNLFIGELL